MQGSDFGAFKISTIRTCVYMRWYIQIWRNERVCPGYPYLEERCPGYLRVSAVSAGSHRVCTFFGAAKRDVFERKSGVLRAFEIQIENYFFFFFRFLDNFTAGAVLRLCSSKVHVRMILPKIPSPNTLSAPRPTLAAVYPVCVRRRFLPTRK